MQQCPTCGSMNPDDADVCADCGMELPGHGSAPATPPQTPATPAPAPALAPTANSFDFASESAHTTPESAPAPATPASMSTPAPTPPVEGSTDPFGGNEWNFDLNDTSSAPPAPPETPATPATPDVPVTPEAAPMSTAPTQVMEPPATPTPPAPMAPTVGTAKLILKRGGAPTGDVFSIGSSATVGRFDPESGPVDVDMANLPEAVYISRHHAELNLRDGQWLVKDLGSRNGTFVKSASGFARVTGETPVTSGDEVAFGNARFEFQAS